MVSYCVVAHANLRLLFSRKLKKKGFCQDDINFLHFCVVMYISFYVTPIHIASFVCRYIGSNRAYPENINFETFEPRNSTHVLTSTQLRNAENCRLISFKLVVYELKQPENTINILTLCTLLVNVSVTTLTL